MRILFILALLLFASCEDTFILKQRSCFLMTISDATPVQFWLAGCETYNEKEVPGINRACFCQPFQCDDQIKIQFSDTAGLFFELKVIDSDGGVVHIFQFSEITSGVYSLTFTPSDYSPDVCDTVRFVIIKWTNILSTTWLQTDTPAPGWSLQSDGTYRVTLINPTNTETLYQTSPSSTAVKIAFKVTQTSTGIRPTDVHITAGSYSEVFNLIGNDSMEAVVDVNITGIADVEIYANKSNISGTNTVTFHYVKLFTSEVYTEVAFSDCISIKETQDETVLITYSNHRSFAGTEYSNISPDPDFYIRVPAVFFQERFPQEQEVMELSDNREIQLNSEIKAERLFDTGHMPFYMHRKLIQVFMQQYITIDGISWVKGNAYEILETENRRYPMRRGQIWLTQQDYIARNIL